MTGSAAATLDTPPQTAEPVPEADRIGVLDILRGFAVLGILIMNIQSFAMVDSAYFNPTVWGDLTGVNYAVWLLSHLFADMKFMTIFSMLFGAGIVLLCGRVERRGARPVRVHLRRTGWLLAFGLAHAYLLWTGDILVWYSFSALLAYGFWRMRPGRLILWALFFLSVGSALYLFFQWSMPYWPPEAIDGNRLWWDPPADVVAARLDAYRGGWLAQMAERVPGSLTLQTFVYLFFGLWRTLGAMLAGMAFLKWGILSAERTTRFYLGMLGVGLACGVPTIGYGVGWNFEHEWSIRYSMFGGTFFNYWGFAPRSQRVRRGGHARVSGRLAAGRPAPARIGRPDGLHELHPADRALHDAVLRARAWLVRLCAAMGSGANRPRRVGRGHRFRERLAGSIPLRPARVALAVVDVSEAATAATRFDAGQVVVRCDIEARPGGTFVVTDRRDGEDVAVLGRVEQVLRQD